VVGVFCPNCGHRNPEGVNFCSSCGASLVTTVPDTSVSNIPVDNLTDGTDEDSPVGLLELPVASGSSWSSGGGRGGPLRPGVGGHPGRPPPESDIFLDDITVSRRHAEFVTRDEVTSVRDVGSLNGTYVNRERIEEARLSSGDEVQIGKFKLLYLVAAGE